MAWGPDVTLKEGISALLARAGMSVIPPGLFIQAGGQAFQLGVTVYEMASALAWPEVIVMSLMQQYGPAGGEQIPMAEAVRPTPPTRPVPPPLPADVSRAGPTTVPHTQAAGEQPAVLRPVVQMSGIMDAFKGQPAADRPTTLLDVGAGAAGAPANAPASSKTAIVPSMPAKAPDAKAPPPAKPVGPLTDTGLHRLVQDTADKRKTMVVRDAEPVDDDEVSPAEQARMEVESRPPPPSSRSAVRPAQPEFGKDAAGKSASGIRRALKIEEPEPGRKREAERSQAPASPAPARPAAIIAPAEPAPAGMPKSDSGLFDVIDAVKEGAVAAAASSSLSASAAGAKARSGVFGAQTQLQGRTSGTGIRAALPAKTLRRRASVRWYSRMNLQRMFPLVVLLAKARMKQVTVEDVGHAVATKMVAVPESNPYVLVRPVLPGCLVFPPEQRVDISPDEVPVRFQVVPQLLGEVKDARIEIYHHDRLLVQIPVEAEVVTQTAARVASVASVIWPFLSSVLKGEGQTAVQGSLMQYIGEALRRPYAMESGIAALLAAAFVLYLANRPRESSEEREFSGASPMTAAELIAAGRQALTDRKWEEAESFFEDAVNVAPRDAGARAGLARARRYAVSPQKSLESLAEALELDIADAEVFYQLACSRAALGRKAEAMAALRESVRRGLHEPGRMHQEADLAGLASEPEFKILATGR
jgi:hypothetical protein